MSDVDLNSLELTERVITERGIWLPFERWNWAHTNVDESGTVFINTRTLYELSEQSCWDSQFGKILLLDLREGLALEQVGLAIHETKGGYCRSEILNEFLGRIGVL